MGQKQTTLSVNKVSNETGRGFLLLSPKKNMDVDRTARRLASCSGVDQVFLTSGEYGFVVSTRHGVEKVRSRLRRIIRGTGIAVVVHHRIYRLSGKQKGR